MCNWLLPIFDYDFLSDCPFTNARGCQLLCAALSSNVGVLGMWACSVFLSFNYHTFYIDKTYAASCDLLDFHIPPFACNLVSIYMPNFIKRYTLMKADHLCPKVLDPKLHFDHVLPIFSLCSDSSLAWVYKELSLMF